MKYSAIRKISLFVLFALLSVKATQSQIIPPGLISKDSTDNGVVLVRPMLERVRYIPRSAKLTNPVVTLRKVKALEKPFKRFRVPSFWERENALGLTINEVAFVNWNAGGDNSISALAKASFARNYKFRYVQWNNDLELRFGWNAQEGRQLRKTDDAIRFSSTFGFRRDTLSGWYYSVKTKFNTQFADGFKYPDRSTPISRFMAPGYLFLGAGASYIPEGQKLNIYISPVTLKATFVLDQDLADRGAFGVEKAVLDDAGNVLVEGENIFMELGFLLTNTWETEVYKNVLLKHKLSMYTDYLRSFGNVDFDWELNFDLKVNEYISANIGTHVIYDDDILFDQVVADDGTVVDPGVQRIQFKQLLGVGMSYSF